MRLPVFILIVVGFVSGCVTDEESGQGLTEPSSDSAEDKEQLTPAKTDDKPTISSPSKSRNPKANRIIDTAPSGMVLIPEGAFQMGGDAGEMGGNSHSHQSSYPIHQVELDAYWINKTEVTNRQFAEFVEATDYVTFAEKPLPAETLKQLRQAAEFNLRQLKNELLHCPPEQKEAIEATIQRVEDAAKLS
ncbi:MAG: SUMF1/EgtB/PvdO family nonheme iron enzyme, partial [Planctomycetota bacterium]